jgi:hypothetical protein
MVAMSGSKQASHYEIGDWVDFVRGLVSPQLQEKMQSHLHAGCKECGEVAGLFSRIAERAIDDAKYEVPEYVVRNLRALYSLQRPEEVRLLPRTIARLVFDSFREPLVAGVRSQQSVAHQLMYVAGPYCVDLRLEREPGSKHIRMVGQIAKRERRATGVSEVPVFLLARNLVVNKTATNEFGEFAMEYTPRHGLRLFAPIPGENHIEIRLGRVASTRSTA